MFYGAEGVNQARHNDKADGDDVPRNKKDDQQHASTSHSQRKDSSPSRRKILNHRYKNDSPHAATSSKPKTTHTLLQQDLCSIFKIILSIYEMSHVIPPPVIRNAYSAVHMGFVSTPRQLLITKEDIVTENDFLQPIFPSHLLKGYQILSTLHSHQYSFETKGMGGGPDSQLSGMDLNAKETDVYKEGFIPTSRSNDVQEITSRNESIDQCEEKNKATRKLSLNDFLGGPSLKNAQLAEDMSKFVNGSIDSGDQEQDDDFLPFPRRDILVDFGSRRPSSVENESPTTNIMEEDQSKNDEPSLLCDSTPSTALVRLQHVLTLATDRSQINELTTTSLFIILPKLLHEIFHNPMPYIEEQRLLEETSYYEHQNLEKNGTDNDDDVKTTSFSPPPRVSKLLIEFIKIIGGQVGKLHMGMYVLPRVLSLLSPSATLSIIPSVQTKSSCAKKDQHQEEKDSSSDKYCLRFLQMMLLSPLLPILCAQTDGSLFLKQVVPWLISLLKNSDSYLNNENCTLQNKSSFNIPSSQDATPGTKNNLNEGSSRSIEELEEETADSTRAQQLYESKEQMIISCQKAAAVSLTILSQEDALGPALCCRYIVPALVSSMSDVTLHAKANHKFQNCVYNHSTGPKTHVSQALVGIIPFLPDEAIGMLICKPLLMSHVPALLDTLLPPNSSTTVATASSDDRAYSQWEDHEGHFHSNSKESDDNLVENSSKCTSEIHRQSPPSSNDMYYAQHHDGPSKHHQHHSHLTSFAVTSSIWALTEIVAVLLSCLPSLSSDMINHHFFRGGATNLSSGAPQKQVQHISSQVAAHQLLFTALSLAMSDQVLSQRRRVRFQKHGPAETQSPSLSQQQTIHTANVAITMPHVAQQNQPIQHAPEQPPPPPSEHKSKLKSSNRHHRAASLAFLSSIGKLLCSLTKCLSSSTTSPKIVLQGTIFPIMDSFCARLIREHAIKLNRCVEILNESDELLHEPIVENVMSLPGLLVAREVCVTLIKVCTNNGSYVGNSGNIINGMDVLVEYCPSVKDLLVWIMFQDRRSGENVEAAATTPHHGEESSFIDTKVMTREKLKMSFSSLLTKTVSQRRKNSSNRLASWVRGRSDNILFSTEGMGEKLETNHNINHDDEDDWNVNGVSKNTTSSSASNQATVVSSSLLPYAISEEQNVSILGSQMHMDHFSSFRENRNDSSMGDICEENERLGRKLSGNTKLSTMVRGILPSSKSEFLSSSSRALQYAKKPFSSSSISQTSDSDIILDQNKNVEVGGSSSSHNTMLKKETHESIYLSNANTNTTSGLAHNTVGGDTATAISQSPPLITSLLYSHHASNINSNDELERRREDWAWTMGGFGPNEYSKPWTRIGTPWSTRMLLLSSLADNNNRQGMFDDSNRKNIEHGNGPSGVSCMAVNGNENLLATGGQNGQVLLWDLGHHPPAIKSRFNVRNNKDNGNQKDKMLPFSSNGIHQVDLLNQHGMGLVCNGSLHLWELETNRTVTSLFRKNHHSPIVAFAASNAGSGVGEGLDFGGKAFGEIFAIDSTQLLQIDLRMSSPLVHQRRQQHSAAGDGCSSQSSLFRDFTWFFRSQSAYPSTGDNSSIHNSSQRSIHRKEAVLVSPERHHAVATQASSFSLSCITVQCNGGDWVCVGSMSGYVHCFERRKGTMLHCWKAHNKAVVSVKALNRHQVLTVSHDQTAILWDLRGTPLPEKLSCIQDLPCSGSGMRMQSVDLHRLELRNSKEASLKKRSIPVLYAASGHKAVSAAIPTPGTQDLKVEPKRLRDAEGKRISKKKLCIQSMAILPLRQLLLFGCEDGSIHACV